MSVQLAILGFLQQRDLHGYELKKTIEQKMGMWTDIKFGSIYHALNNLERSEFITRVHTSSLRGKPARSVFSITGLGRGEFKRLLTENILVHKPIFLKEDIGIYFGGKIDSQELKRIVTSQIDSLSEFLNELREHRGLVTEKESNNTNLAHWLISRHIRHLEVDIAWFQHIRNELAGGRLYQPADNSLTEPQKS